MTLARHIARQKFRFDLGQGFLSVLQLCLLSIAAGDSIGAFVGLRPLWVTVALVPSVLVAVWVVGTVLDRLGYFHAYQAEMNERNELLKAVHSATKR